VTDKIAIIGFGNIANAIVTPLLDNKLIKPENVFCVVNTEKSLENIKKNYKYILKIKNNDFRGSLEVFKNQKLFFNLDDLNNLNLFLNYYYSYFLLLYN